MQLVLVRHGQSTNNARYAQARELAVSASSPQTASRVFHYPGRRPDPELTTTGVQQALRLGTALSGGQAPFAPTHLYASPTLRAVQTAQPLTEATGLPLRLHPDAYEVGGIHLFDPESGVRRAHPGATLVELRTHCPSVEAAPGVFTAPDQPWSGGLEMHDEQALPRAERLVGSLLAAHRPDDVVLLVSHQYFSQFVLAAVFGWSGPPWQHFRIDNTGHLSLRLDDGSPSVGWVNRVDHLDPAEVTN